MVTVRRHDSVDDFEARARDFLLEREAEHNLFLGICTQIREGRYSDPYLATVGDGGRIVAAAWRTPPYQLGISHVDDPAATDVLAHDVKDAFATIPGVLAAKDDARRFADVWMDITAQRGEILRQQRIYQVTDVVMPDAITGEPRAATERDDLIEWFTAFMEEIGDPTGAVEETVDYRLDPNSSAGQIWWWDDGPVSLAGYAGSTPNGNRIGPVYTPPALRGRGYASASVATLTRQLLDEGRQFCFLYTDLANPTSNSIYQKIGYTPVCDVDQYRFA